MRFQCQLNPVERTFRVIVLSLGRWSSSLEPKYWWIHLHHQNHLNLPHITSQRMKQHETSVVNTVAFWFVVIKFGVHISWHMIKYCWTSECEKSEHQVTEFGSICVKKFQYAACNHDGNFSFPSKLIPPLLWIPLILSSNSMQFITHQQHFGTLFSTAHYSSAWSTLKCKKVYLTACWMLELIKCSFKNFSIPHEVYQKTDSLYTQMDVTYNMLRTRIHMISLNCTVDVIKNTVQIDSIFTRER